MNAKRKKTNQKNNFSKKLKFQKNKYNENKELEHLKSELDQFDCNLSSTFAEFPLSEKSKKGLGDNNYINPTEIQRDCILQAIKGHDILGAAKTGSGKTLAFLIPVLEILNYSKWTKLDGLGALIITPTRELALQIYEELVKVGKYHDFSVGLIIGGKDLHFEKSRLTLVNIIIGTPGRLLQHMDENPLFSCCNLKILILDEADRCLDMGFEKSLNAIIEHLPKERLTLLFSATQTRNVKDLIRLSLKDPKYISVHEHEKHKTPEGLTQSFMLCEEHKKFPVIWSFICNHLKQKIIIFLSTCHQVKYTYEILRKLHPRISIFALHGKLHQLKRMDVYHEFCRKKFAVLIATDIAARGLDFPEVNWVIQLDCPEDVSTYIHRAGRTARYHKGGECLLILRPSEKKIIDYLSNNKIPLNEISINPSKIYSPQVKIEAFLAKSPELKKMAQRAFVSYFKAVFLMKDKTIFDVTSINIDQYARSLGLVVTPRVRFLQRKLERESNEKFIDEPLTSNSNEIETNYVKQKNINYNFDIDETEELLTVKRRNHNLETGDDMSTMDKLKERKVKKPITKISLAKKILKKKILPNKKVLFNENGEVIVEKMKEKISEFGKKYDDDADKGVDLEEAKKLLKEEDVWDKQLFREKVKARKRQEKIKLKQEKRKARGQIAEKEEKNSDDQASDSDSCDLSWLPDPDVIYGKENDNNTSKEKNSDVSDKDEDEEDLQESQFDYNRDDWEDSDDDNNDNREIKQKEKLVLQLLSRK